MIADSFDKRFDVEVWLSQTLTERTGKRITPRKRFERVRPLLVAARDRLSEIEQCLRLDDIDPADGSKQEPEAGASPNQLLTPKQAADMVGATVETLRKWRSTNTDGPPYHTLPSGHVRYMMGDLMAYLASRRVAPAYRSLLDQNRDRISEIDRFLRAADAILAEGANEVPQPAT